MLCFVWVGGRSRAGGRLQRSSVVEETNGDTLSTDASWYFLEHFLARGIRDAIMEKKSQSYGLELESWIFESLFQRLMLKAP